MDKKIIQEALNTVKKFGYIVERGEFNDPSNRPEFYDPDYGWDGRDPEYDHDEDDYEARCANDKELVEGYIKEKHPNVNCDVYSSYDIDEDKVKFYLEIIFNLDHLPTQKEQDDLDAITQECGDLKFDIDWDDSDISLISVNSSGKCIERLDNPNVKNVKPVEDTKVDHYEFSVNWYASETVDVKEYEDDRDYDDYDEERDYDYTNW